MDVDDAGRDPFAGAVDLERPAGLGKLGPADRLDDAVGEDDRAVVERRPSPSKTVAWRMTVGTPG